MSRGVKGILDMAAGHSSPTRALLLLLLLPLLLLQVGSGQSAYKAAVDAVKQWTHLQLGEGGSVRDCEGV